MSKNTSTKTDLGNDLMERAINLLVDKLSEAMNPFLANIDMRIEKIEQIVLKPADGEESVSLVTNDSNVCSYKGCNKKARARGLCSAHYQKVRYQEKMLAGIVNESGGDPTKLVHRFIACSEPNCQKPVKAKGLCSAHYQRKLYHERKVESDVKTDERYSA